jgi:hypothetical protein
MFMSLPGFVIPGFAPICGDSNDPLTVKNGVWRRLMRDLPNPDQKVLTDFFRFVRRWARKNIPAVDPMTFEEWLERSTYNEERKGQLRATWEELRGGLPSRSKCAKVKSFVKTEAYQEFKHVRMINSRSDQFKVLSGPFFSSLENEVYKHPAFIKHVPVPDRPRALAALQTAGRHIYATDFTAFESHFVSNFMANVECCIYERAFRNHPEASALITSALTGLNFCSTRTGLRYKLLARRMSGDTCTSLGNGLTNYLLALYICTKQGKTLSGFVEGDDGLFVTNATLTAKHYEQLGFTIKIERHESVQEAGFCQMYFSDDLQLVKSPFAVIHKFSWTSSCLYARELIRKQLLRAKALSGVYETPHCPILGALYRAALRYTDGVAPRFVMDGYHQIPRDTRAIPDFSPTAETRRFFAQKFGVPVHLQLAAESAIHQGDMTKVAEILTPSADMMKYSQLYLELGGT